ncbi:MAG: hypothetical protein GF331_15390 [Chitinivibrionales bacterium]|nr:hypothetical protein [Chitinivibrionales bacterium]
MNMSRTATHPRLRARAILVSLRAYSFPASVMPILVAASLAWVQHQPIAWYLFPFVIVSALALHAGTNLINDLEDYRRGLDTAEYPGSSGMLAGPLSPRAVAWEAVGAFALAVTAALPVVAIRGPAIALLALAGLWGAYGYSGRPFGLKYHGAGDMLVFVMMGPGLVAGGYYALTGVLSVEAAALSLPVGTLVTAVLHGNNIRDREHDRQAGLSTLADRLGPTGALALFIGLLATSYAVPFAMILSGRLSAWTLLLVATLPMAVSAALSVARNIYCPRQLADIDRRLAGLHGAYGLALMLGLLIEGIGLMIVD